jgi:hypothetical protein
MARALGVRSFSFSWKRLALILGIPSVEEVAKALKEKINALLHRGKPWNLAGAAGSSEPTAVGVGLAANFNGAACLPSI